MRSRSLLWFFGLAYAVSWALWFPAVVESVSVIGPLPSRYLHLAGGLGPMLAAVTGIWTRATVRSEGR